MNYTNFIKFYDNYVIKKSNKNHNTYLDRKNEEKILKYFKENKPAVIAKIVDIFNIKGTLYTKMENLKDYIEFNPTFCNEENLKTLIEAIKLFHNINIPNIKVFNYKDFFFNLYNKINHHIFEFDMNEMNRAIEHLNSVEDKCLSHNDLVPNNILFTKDKKNVKLIDFDYTMINNRLFDYVSFLTESLFEQKDINIYVHCLMKEGVITSKNLVQFRHEIYYQDILWITWANYLYELTNDKKFMQIHSDKVENFETRIISI